jgi:hypothetical protein
LPKVGDKPQKRHKIPFQDLLNGRFLCLKPHFSLFSDFALGDEKIGIPRDSFFVFLPVNTSQHESMMVNQ